MYARAFHGRVPKTPWRMMSLKLGMRHTLTRVPKCSRSPCCLGFWGDLWLPGGS